MIKLGLLTLFFCLTVCDASWADVIYSRSLQIGTTAEIKKKEQTQPQPYHMSALVSRSAVAKIGVPPPPCGLTISKYFRNTLVKTFAVIPLSSCSESQIYVDCSSEMFESSSTFIQLIYSYQPLKEMHLDLSVLSRTDLGDVVHGQAPRKLKLELAKLWDELTELALCTNTETQ